MDQRPSRRAVASSSTHLPSMCLAVLVTACGGARYEHLVERELAASDELTCPGYLAWNREPVRDVFLVINGSGTLSNAFHEKFCVCSSVPVYTLTSRR